MVDENVLPQIGGKLLKLNTLKKKILDLQSQLDKIDKFKNEILSTQIWQTFTQNYNFWASGLFGFVIGCSVGLFTVPIIAPVVGVIMSVFLPVMLGLTMLFFTGGWVFNSLLVDFVSGLIGNNYLSYIYNYLMYYISIPGFWIQGQGQLINDYSDILDDHFNLLKQYHFRPQEITDARPIIASELLKAQNDLADLMSKE
jgi:hypothetical protein